MALGLHILCLLTTGHRHIPHDAVHGVAVAPLPGGDREIVAVLNDYSRVLRSGDDGLSWEVLAGAGLETTVPCDVVHYPRGSVARFFIATSEGVWAYEPASRLLVPARDGLPASNWDVLDIDAPLPGSNGPAVLITKRGTIFTWNEGLMRWQLALQANSPNQAGAVAVMPRFDATTPSGPYRALAAAADGVLHLSDDGGMTWSVHSQFSTPATSWNDWRILALCFSEDYAQSGILLVGQMRLRALSSLAEQGIIWRSGDYGQSFAAQAALPIGINSLAATPPDGSGRRWMLAAGSYFPGVPAGVFLSEDGGLNWNDRGNHQDLALEDGAGPIGTGIRGWLRWKQGFAVWPEFASEALVLHGRPEGLYASKDAGLNWRQQRLRAEEELRDVTLAPDANGHLAAFGAAYGSGTLAQNLTVSEVQVLDAGCIMPYQKEVEVSPHFASDGTVAIGGRQNLLFWFDPRVPPVNPFGVSGWFTPPLTDVASGQRYPGYVRMIALSPHFDNRGLPGTDQTLYWSAWDLPPMRTVDGGVTAERLPQLANGGEVPFLELLAVAPTYDASAASGRTDVYGCNDTRLYRLRDTVWEFVHEFDSRIHALAVDPGFTRPANPRLFLALLHAPYVVTCLDLPTGAQVQSLRGGLDVTTLIQSLAVPPNFRAQPVLYAGTWGQGVLRLDLSRLPLQWYSVGQGFPPWYIHRLSCSPNFAQDHVLAVATQHGLVYGSDAAAFTWTASTLISSRDNSDPGFTWFAPTDPSNPQPERPWRWESVTARQLGAAVPILGTAAAKAVHDGSAVETSGYARELCVHTAEGANAGTLYIVVSDRHTGALLAWRQVDLGATGGALRAAEIRIYLSTLHAVAIRMATELDSGEFVVFDRLTFQR